MFSTFIGLIDIQSWWEVPCIAHFCSLFSGSFQLPDFDIEDLEEALLTDADVESEVDLKIYNARLLSDLIVALLKGCDALSQIVAHISPSNYQMFLRRLFRQKCQEYNIDNPFNTDTDFEKLPLRTKILILKYLCDFRLDSADVFNSFANLQADSLRVEPLGYDSKGSAYWYFFGTRLYREDYEVQSGKGTKSSKRSVWQVICFTEEDWRNLAGKFQQSKNKNELALHQQLEENFLPNIPKIFRDKERERRNRLLERRTSSRIKLCEERRLAELYRQQEIEQQQLLLQQQVQALHKKKRTPEAAVSGVAYTKPPNLSEERAKRAERRSRSNSVTSIVSTYASSPEPLTSDLIFQQKECESPIPNTTLSKHSSTKHYTVVTTLPASPSSELGSEQTTSADILVVSEDSKRDPEYYDGNNVEEVADTSVVVESLNNNQCTEVASCISVASSDTTSSGVSSRKREKSPSSPLREDFTSVPGTPSPHGSPIAPKKKSSKRPNKSLSAEIERLLQYNRNMAPTTTKLPGRQTNNSLSSVTGPVILPFAETPPKTSGSSSSASKSGDSNAGGGTGAATKGAGRKKKSKASQVFTTYSSTLISSFSFTETEEVLQIGMHKVLEYIKNHDDAWPFMDPVEEDIAPRYYSIIRRPMDLQKMEEKLDNGEYLSFADFRNDFRLIVNNCRLYNGQANEYTEMVNNLQIAFEKATKKYFDSNSSDEEQTLEYPIFKEKPFASNSSTSGTGKIQESAGSGASTSNNNNNNNSHNKSSKENKSGNSKKSSNSNSNSSNSGKTGSGTAKDGKSVASVQPKSVASGNSSSTSSKTDGKSKDTKKEKSEVSDDSFKKKQSSGDGSSAKKGKSNVQSDPKPCPEESNSKGLKRKRKDKDKNGKTKTKKMKTSDSDDRHNEDSEHDQNEENKKGVKSAKEDHDFHDRFRTSDRNEEAKKSSSKLKRKEEKAKNKGKIKKSKTVGKMDKRGETEKRGRQKSRSRSRSSTRSKTASPISGMPSSSPNPFITPKKKSKREELSPLKTKHNKKARKKDHSSDRDAVKNSKKPVRHPDTSLSSISPSPVKRKGRSGVEKLKQEPSEDSIAVANVQNERKERNLADIDNAKILEKKSGYISGDSANELSVGEDNKKEKKLKKGLIKIEKSKGKNKNDEKQKKNKLKGKSKKSKPKNVETPSLVGSSNDDELEEPVMDDKNKKSLEKENISASKKQPKDFSKYTTLPRDRSSSRSFSRSPSPLPSIRDDYSSFSDHSIDFDDVNDVTMQTKQLLSRPITPDIKDKYDLIKQRRRNQASVSQPNSSISPVGEKPLKSKHKTHETNKKKTKTIQPLDTSASASTIALKESVKPNEKERITSKETTKSNKKRDHSSELPTDTPAVESPPKWSESEPQVSSVEKQRSSYKGEKMEKPKETEKKVGRSDEYDFVDDLPPAASIAPSIIAPIASPIEKDVKLMKPKGDSSKKSNQKSNKTNHNSSSRVNAGLANKQPKASGANMEALELETEQTLKDINKWLENTPRFSEYSSASNSPSRYIMDDLDAVTAKIDAADFRKPIPLSQLPEETEKPIIPSPQSVAPPPLTVLPTPAASMVMSPKRMTPPISKEQVKLKQPKETLTESNPIKESVNNVNNTPSARTQLPQPQHPPLTNTIPQFHQPVPPPVERTLLGPPPIIPPHSQKKEPKETKRKSLKEKLSQLGSRKRETVQHRTNIDRLQPGKSKGNLISSIQNLNKPEEMFPLGGAGVSGSTSAGLGGTKLKEVKNSLIVKTDESKPKLSLGTVLNTAEGFGLGQQHEFADEKKDHSVKECEDKEDEKETESLNSSKDDSGQSDKLLIHDDLKAAKTELMSKTDPSKIVESPEKVIKAVTKSDKPSATPNLSAWFKAFGGAPKKPKKTEEGDESASKISPNDGVKATENTPPSDVPIVPSLESPSYPSLPAPRQRKASTGSTVSERSSYSQDPDSPRIGIDERIGGYPAPYPSPMGASPVMTSPKLDDTQKSPYPMNGAIKVGFYQDTTTKSSPEKSCSPRDLPSPYPQYSQHLYTANSGISGNNLYGNYAYGANSATANNPMDNFKNYDQYKQPASQESDYNSSMSPSTNPNSPYHNQQSSPYQQQPNSPYQGQQNQNYNQPIPSPASSGPLSPYSNTSLAPQSSVQQSPAQSVSGHSPFNPSPTSPYQTPQHPSQNQQPQTQKPNQPQQTQQHSSKPNTPIHQSPNSPFSQSNHSSPYSQQDPNSPYSQGQLSPFQPMSPKPQQSAGTTNNSLQLAPPIITPQQAAAAAGVTLPESPVNNLSLSTQQTSPQQQPQQVQPPTGSQLSHQQSQLGSQVNTQPNWNQHQTYNQYPATAVPVPADSSAIGMGSNLPAPAHMHHQSQPLSQPQQQQQPQPAHHNTQQMQTHLLPPQTQQHPPQQQQPHQLQPLHPQQTSACTQQSLQHQNLNNLTPAHSQSSVQQQHSHLSNLLSNNPYTSNYGRQAYESTVPISQSHSQDGISGNKNQPTKVPELINLGYNNSSSNENSTSNKNQPLQQQQQQQQQQQDIPMNMGSKAIESTKDKDLAKQQQMFELMGAMGYGNPMDISISKSKAFDMFNRAATMTFPRGFPPSAGGGGSGQIQQDSGKSSYPGSNSSGYDQMQTNTNKARDMSGTNVYGIPQQQSHQQQPKTNQNDLLSAGNLRGNTAGYDQRPSGNVTAQQQQHNNIDLSTSYKSFGGQSTLMDPALRNLASLSSLYQADERLLGSGSTTAGYYDKAMPPAAHMFGKSLPAESSSTVGSVASTSALQQMFNTSMATTMAYNAAARDQQSSYGTNYLQRNDLLSQGQKVPLNIPSVPNPTIPSEPSKPKRGRKKKETQDMLQQQQSQIQHQQQAHQQHQQQQQQPNAAHQGFQSYSGLKTSHPSSSSSNHPVASSSTPGNVTTNSNSEPSAISLKTANVVPGSAFNFGPGPTGLSLPSSLYSDNSPYLDEFRQNPNPYPYLPSSHPRGPSVSSSGPSDGSDKVGNPTAPTASAAVAAAAAAATVVHQPPPAASPYHQFLSHPSSRPSPYQFMNQLDPLHQQYIRQEELRAQMMLNQSLGLGAPGAHGPPPGAYGQPGAYHPALGIHKPYDAMNSMNRPPWL